MANYAWYGALVAHNIYEAAEFLDVGTYTHVLRWVNVRAHDIVDKFLTEAWLTTSLTFLRFISLQKLQPPRKGPLYRPLRTILW
jgi:hypothetical protein